MAQRQEDNENYKFRFDASYNNLVRYDTYVFKIQKIFKDDIKILFGHNFNL